VCLASVGTTRAESLTGLGHLVGASSSQAYGVSGNGQVVVGQSGSHAFRWTQGQGIVALDLSANASTTTAASFDGSVIVGAVGSPGTGTYHAYLWNLNGSSPLGSVPGYALSQATAVSSNGTVIVGFCKLSEFTDAYTAFRWTAPSGMVNLGGPSGAYWRAYGVTGDGLAAVGGPTAIRWTAPGVWQLLESSSATSWALAVSGDGAVVVGRRYRSGGYHAFRWTSAAGIVEFDLPGYSFSAANAANGDGSVIVGSASSATSDVACVWTELTGTISLSAYLGALGVDLTGWTLQTATGVSADGRTVVGNGLHNGVSEGWIATLPSWPHCGSADFNHDGDTATDADIEAFFACIAGACCPACDSADFNADGDVATDADIEAFFRVLAGGNC
jgi:probable HAF family extracellular repeat protein